MSKNSDNQSFFIVNGNKTNKYNPYFINNTAINRSSHSTNLGMLADINFELLLKSYL